MTEFKKLYSQCAITSASNVTKPAGLGYRGFNIQVGEENWFVYKQQVWKESPRKEYRSDPERKMETYLVNTMVSQEISKETVRSMIGF